MIKKPKLKIQKASEKRFEQKLNESVEFIKRTVNFKPTIGIILGSGLGAFAEGLERKLSINYSIIPNFPKANVVGHKGNVVFGECAGKKVAVFQGRWHCYEGFSARDVAFNVCVLHKLDVNTLIVTNSAGAINKSFGIGEIIIINDHINFLHESPLEGNSTNERFVDMTNAYNVGLIEIARRALEKINLPFKTGIYLAARGPNYETPAEIRMMKSLGADLVGMSTVPEVITARKYNMRVLAFSVVTNYAGGIAKEILSHEEVIEIASMSEKNVVNFLKTILFEL